MCQTLIRFGAKRLQPEMWSPNKRKPDSAEAAYIAAIKLLPCACCGKAGPSEAHEIVQGLWWLSIPLCANCHRDEQNGLHGAKATWKALKKTENGCLNDTIRVMQTGASNFADAPVRKTRTLPRAAAGDLLPKIVPRRIA